ncbi:MAG: 30S ribosomal protein S9, partial [Chloroflexi bacterium]|nr:30S ribosomal protein S9 [Chloroflexota bacterium]
ADRFNVVAKIEGGGVSAWADALRHGIARALLLADPSLKKELRKHGYLTRDSRIKESKKYGLKRARRAPQYTKR